MIWTPRRLLAFDAVGALTTALVTFFVLASGVLPTGLPSGFLVGMAAVAVGFAIFDLVALNFGWFAALRVIAVANGLYCLAMIGAVVGHHASVTPLGVGYVVAESVVVVALARWEWKVARDA